MAPIDSYAYCPCGSGKKLKFCCHDIADEMGKIQDMLQGGQRAACLDYIESIEKKFPDRAYLVTTKALLQSALGSQGAALATLENFLAKEPNNSVALAEHGLVTATLKGPIAGVASIQKALEAGKEALSGRVVASVERLGEMLMMDGQVMAARGHFMLSYTMNPNDEQSLQMLARFFGAPNIPLPLKNEQTLVPAPEGVAWKAEFDTAIDGARRGLWQSTADKLAVIAEQNPTASEPWRNLAILRGWLADTQGSIAALRKLSTLDIPWDEKVEAEALAQILDSGEDTDVVDEMRVSFEIRDFEKVVETLATDKRSAATAWESLGIDLGDQPPPRAAYFLLDRTLPATGANIARQDVPCILAKLLLFGRQTDREARLDAYLRRTEIDAAKKALGELLGDALAPAGEPEKIGETPTAEASLSWSWRLPDDVAAAHVRKIVEEQRRETVLNVWPNTKSKRFGDKTPLEIAGDKNFAVPLAAAVLLIELSFTQPNVESIFVELRNKLNVPQPQTPDAASFGPLGVPYTRLHRLDVKSLSDDDLLNDFQRGLQVIARQAVRKLGLEIIARPALEEKVDMAGVYGHLADLEDGNDQALAYIELARKASEKRGQSSAPWDLEELELRLRRGEVEEFGRLADHIQTQHLREPGVAQHLMNILYQAGIVDENGRPRGGRPGGDPFSMPGASAPPAESNKLWTPDSPGGAAPAASGGKSGLWMPGMD
jgi:hypothetical protein